ncbi:hypothetical protein ABZS66_35615 [Dactylosporangium sp. NPDC005572]|uniref:hypothetical protein n=1 Tax=Dactylosporangium sp. NPDC005572 TaxID=3156889 RepID=UPI0033A225D9
MTAPLEARLQRLMRTYPATYRRAHGADMLTTMLADATPGQRWPRFGDAANLVFHGLRLRLTKRSRGEAFDAGWADACAVLGPLIALVLLALRLPVVLRMPPEAFRPPFNAETVAGISMLSAGLEVVGWAAVAVAALAGLRRTAALFAWAALLAEVVPLVRLYDVSPVPVVHGLWRPALALVAAVALSAAGSRGAAAVLGRRRLGTVLVTLTVIDVIAVILGPGSVTQRTDEGWTYLKFFPSELIISSGPSGYWIESPSPTAMGLTLLGLAVALLALIVAVVTVPGPIRRRLLVAVAPVITVILTINLTLPGWAASNDHMGHPIALVPVQWAALAGLPLLTFALGLRWVRRRDEVLRLAALGATVEQPVR